MSRYYNRLKRTNVNMVVNNPSALSEAARIGDHQTIEKLISEGADLNYESIMGQPLFLAVSSGHTECVRILLKAGADVNITHNGKSLRTVACNREIIKMLVAAGVDINKPNREGRTEIHILVKAYKHDLLISFLEAGANIDAIDRNGQTILHYIAQRRYGDGDDELNLTTIKMLLKYNADNTIRDKAGKLAIEYATDPAIIDVLTNYQYIDPELKEPDEIYNV